MAPAVLQRIAVGLTTIGVVLGLVGADAGARSVVPYRPPAADCQPFGAAPCLLPFPGDLFTRRDSHTPTGLRIQLPEGAMPVNQGAPGPSLTPTLRRPRARTH
jgi:hypothetical protein